MTKLKLKAQVRKTLGRKVKKLRGEGLTPANIYGKKVKSTAVSIDTKEFEKLFKEAGETTLIDLDTGKDKRTVLIRNVQVHPVDDQVLHVDFQQVDLKTKVTVEIPVEVVGEAPAEKQGLGTVVQHVDEIEVEALPTDLPEKFEVDASALAEVDQAIFVKDLKVAKGVEVKDDPEKIVVKVEPLRKEEEVAPALPVEGEVAVEGEKPTETPVEGETKPTGTEAKAAGTPTEQKAKPASDKSAARQAEEKKK
ncbi:50S ribosomal protein L25 [Candidatus Woesebacteria bacterium]|nr:50S ribosomal protein L25 [Candidatus Woesebacteria bacterium]